MNNEQVFEIALQAVLRWETSAYTDNPLDPGGATKWGVTQRALASYRGKPVTKEDVRNLTYAEAKEVYRKDYWNFYGCNLLSPIWAFMLFDGVMNQNGKAVCEYFQEALGVKIDGNIGPKTAQAALQADLEEIVPKFLSARAQRYAASKNFPTFGDGWMRRMFDMHRRALELKGK